MSGMFAERTADSPKFDFSDWEGLTDEEKNAMASTLDEALTEAPPYLNVRACKPDDLTISISLCPFGSMEDIGPTWEISIYETLVDDIIDRNSEISGPEEKEMALARASSLLAVALKIAKLAEKNLPVSTDD